MIPDGYPEISVHACVVQVQPRTSRMRNHRTVPVGPSPRYLFQPGQAGGSSCLRARVQHDTVQRLAARTPASAWSRYMPFGGGTTSTCTKLHTRYLQAPETTYARHTIEILITTVRDLSIKSTARARVRSRVQATRDTCYVHGNAWCAASTN
jgi:hypothetical protein